MYVRELVCVYIYVCVCVLVFMYVYYVCMYVYVCTHIQNSTNILKIIQYMIHYI